MPESTADHPAPPSDIKTTLKYAAWGTLPAAAATIAILWQAIAPYVSHNHQGILLEVTGFLGSITLTVWIWCTVQVVRRQFADRDRRADQRVDRLQQEVYVINETMSDRHTEVMDTLAKLCRSVRGLHAHNTHTDEQMGQLAGEIEHLRNLTLGADAPSYPIQQIGPRGRN